MNWRQEKDGEQEIPYQGGGAACLVINERRAGGPAISLEGGGIKFSKHIMVTRNAE
jgi:hypothetical protein